MSALDKLKGVHIKNSIANLGNAQNEMKEFVVNDTSSSENDTTEYNLHNTILNDNGAKNKMTKFAINGQTVPQVNQESELVTDSLTNTSSDTIELSSVPFESTANDDFVFQVGDDEFPTLKATVATKSKKLAILLDKSSLNRLIIKNFEPEVVKVLVDFFKTGEAEKLDEFGDKVAELANKLGVQALVDKCNKFQGEPMVH